MANQTTVDNSNAMAMQEKKKRVSVPKKGDTVIRAIIDENIKGAFEKLCAANDTTASQAIRKFIRDYVKRHDADLYATIMAKNAKRAKK